MKYPTVEIELFAKRHVQLQNGHMLWSSLFFPIVWRYNTGFNEYIFKPLKRVQKNVEIGKWEGLWKQWYNNGQVNEEGVYINGKKESLWKGWYENGQINYEGGWVGGKRTGLWKWWWASGKLGGQNRCYA